MEEQYLVMGIFCVLGLLVLSWCRILYSHVHNSRSIKRQARIERLFSDLVSRYLYGNTSQGLGFIEIQRAFRKLKVQEKHPKNVQYLIDLMIRTLRLLKGKDHQKVKELYVKIPPYRASYRKTLATDWYSVAQGIREIYQMDQRQYLSHLATFKNHPNLYVRREAQIGLVVFLGWDSLRFLPYLDREMELWQQIKIVEQLYQQYPEPQLYYIRHTHDIQSNSGKELLMRIIKKFQIQEGVDFIISQLPHPTFYVREAAVKCLLPFGLNDKQLDQVKAYFPELGNQRLQNKILVKIAASDRIKDRDFFVKLLTNNEAPIRIKVAEILWKRGYQDLIRDHFPEKFKKLSVAELFGEEEKEVSVELAY